MDVTVVVVGPTAAGKSSLAARLVRHYTADGRPAEVINADSMLVYRGMDIGTAKPSERERAEIRHHLIDFFEITQTATVAEFQRHARMAIADCRARDVIPIVVGGSALYVRAIVDDFEFPGTDPAVRARLERELSSHGAQRLHERLSEVDPAGRRPHPPRQYPPGRSGARGHRADRPIVLGRAAGPPIPTSRGRPDRPRGRPADARWSDRRAGGGNVGCRLCRRGPQARGGRSAGESDRVACARLSTGAAFSRRRDQRVRGAGTDGDRHPEVRPTAGFVVSQGRTDLVAAFRSPRSGLRGVRAGRADGTGAVPGGFTPTAGVED